MEGAVVKDSVVMSGSVIEAGAKVEYSILDENVTIGRGASVGVSKDKSKGISVVGADVVIPAGKIIGDNEMISED